MGWRCRGHRARLTFDGWDHRLGILRHVLWCSWLGHHFEPLRYDGYTVMCTRCWVLHAAPVKEEHDG